MASVTSRQPHSTSDETRELATLLEVSRDIASTLELKPLLSLVLERLESVVNNSGAVILTVEEGIWEIRASQGSLPREAIIGHQHPGKDNYFYLALMGRQPIVVPDVQADTPQTRLIPGGRE